MVIGSSYNITKKTDEYDVKFLLRAYTVWVYVSLICANQEKYNWGLLGLYPV